MDSAQWVVRDGDERGRGRDVLAVRHLRVAVDVDRVRGWPAVTSSVYQGGGWMPLADEFHCVAHEDRGGRAWLNSRILGLGLAAALLGELVFAGRIGLVDDRVWVLSRMRVEDPVGQRMLNLLAETPMVHDIRTWLAYFARDAEAGVLSRLVTAGVWREYPGRSWLGSPRVRYVLIDPDAVFYRGVRLARVLGSHDAMTSQDVVLAALVQMTGLAEVLPWDCAADRAHAAHRVTAEIGLAPYPLRRLMACAEVVIGAAVLAPH